MYSSPASFQILASSSPADNSSVLQLIILGLLAIAGTSLLLALYFLPFIIAIWRGHAYKWVILALNVAGVSGILWVIALIWAVWPAERSLIDPIAGNVTGKGRRNLGDTIGSIEYGKIRGYEDESGR